jgi:uncharacterized repeat protein (TIGR01451 family)
MSSLGRLFVATALIGLAARLGTAQVGTINPGGADSPFICMESGSVNPELRPESYTELLGDIIIVCTGGAPLSPGTAVPTANLVLYLSPAVPITSRIVGPNGASEAMLVIDEPGSGIETGATGGYGPQAPQTVCTTAQQQSVPSPCQAYVSTDNSGQYAVAVLPGTSTPAQNVYQGKIGDFGVNSVTFYNIPVLPPAYSGVTRIYRITNIRAAIPGGIVSWLVQGTISTFPCCVPIESAPLNMGVVGPAMTFSVNAAPAGGGNPFMTCAPPAGPTLAARIAYTEGFATAFKTRVVPGGAANGIPNPPAASNPNRLYGAEAQNLAAPFNQNLPGGLYGGFSANSESGFIVPGANTTVADTTYTAGLIDYGTRLKAVFTNIPAGVTLYVSTANAASYPVPGGTNPSPYAVLVAAKQSDEANNDGATFTPLTSAIAGSDGLSAYALTPDASGAAAAIWEVVNADSSAQDVLTFSVYIAYASTPGTTNPTNAALSLAPEPGGGTFSIANIANGTQGLTSPEPRFAVVSLQGGSWATINVCSLDASTTPLSFSYPIGGSVPPSQSRSVTIGPSNLPVSVTPVVTTPAGGTWLSASLTSGALIVSVNPASLSPSATAYTGSVKLSAPGLSDVIVPVTLTVSIQSALSIGKTHTGNFTAGQGGATYTILVDNSASSGTTSGTVTVTEQVPTGLTLVSMRGTGWDCSTLPYCTRSDSLPPGGSWAPITATVNVAARSPSSVTNLVTVTGGASASASWGDLTAISSNPCDLQLNGNINAADVQLIVNQALGLTHAVNDLNGDGAVNVVDVQVEIDAALGFGCAGK